MADDFSFKLKLSTDEFVASLNKAKLENQQFANSFDKTSQAAKESLNTMKSALAAMMASGKGSTDEANKLRTSITESIKEANKLRDAAKQIEEEFKDIGKAAQEVKLPTVSSGGGSGSFSFRDKFKEGRESAKSDGGMFGDVALKLGQLASPIGAATAGLAVLTAGFAASINIGKEFEQNLAGVSAVTGLTGAPLQDLGDRARDLAKKFGGDAATQLTAFQGVLSKFGADLAKTPNELGKVSENINILAKAGGLDAAQSMDVLANSMLQFGVDVANGKEAAAESTRYINVLAASAKVGAAEIPQVGQAVLVAGVAAKGAKVSFEETNAAIQVLAAGGKVGAEAGTALRNVLGQLGKGRFLDKDSAEGLRAAGVDVDKLASKTIPLSERLAELKKITNDTALVSKVFGTENASAATILINGAGTIKDWTAQITGTNEAQEQAAKNMATFGEAMSRLKANIEDVAISVYQFIAPALTFMADALSSLLGGSSDSPLQPLIDGFKSAIAVIKPIADFIVKGIFLYIQIQIEQFKAVALAVGDALGSFFTRIGEIFAPLAEEMQKLFGSLEGGIDVLQVAKTVFGALGDVLNFVLKVVLGIIAKQIEVIVGVFRTLIGYIQTGINWIKEIAASISEWISQSSALNSVISTLSGGLSAFISSIGKVKDAFLDFLGLGDKKVEVKAAIKTEETVTTKETVDDAPAAAAAKAKKEKEGKTAFQLAKEEFELRKSIIAADLQDAKYAIEQVAISQKRKLNADEELKIKELQLKAKQDELAIAREIFKVTGEGSKATTGIKLGVKEKDTAAKEVVKTLTDIENNITGIQFSMFVEDKDAIEATKRALKHVQDDLKEMVKVEALIDIKGEQDARDKIESVRKKAEELRLAGASPAIWKEYAFAAHDAERELIKNLPKVQLERRKIEIESMTDGTKKQQALKIFALEKEYEVSIANARKIGLSTTALEAEFAKKKEEILRGSLNDRLQIAIEALENENSRALAKKILALQKERDEILKNEALTEAQRLAVKKRFQGEISALLSGTDKDTAKAKADLDKQEKDLNKSLSTRKISYADFQKSLDEINAKRAEIDKNTESSRNEIKAVLKLDGSSAKEETADAFGDISLKGQFALRDIQDVGKKMFDSLSTNAELNAGNVKGVFEQMSDSIASKFKRAAGAMQDSFDVAGQGIGGVLGDIGIASGAAFAGVLAESKSFGAAFGGLKESLATSLGKVAEKERANVAEALEFSMKTEEEKSTIIQAAEAEKMKLLAKGDDERTEEETKKLQDINAKLIKMKDSSNAIYGEMAIVAGAAFGQMLLQGASVTDALKQTAVETAGKLLTMYVAPIIASTLAFLGPLAMPVAMGAIGLVQSLFKSSIAGFKTGRHPGLGENPDAPVGIAHGGEDIFTASISRKNRDLFAYLHKGGDASEWFVNQQGLLAKSSDASRLAYNNIAVADNSGLLRTIIDRLDRIDQNTVHTSSPQFRRIALDVQHDPSLQIKAMDRKVHVRKAAL